MQTAQSRATGAVQTAQSRATGAVQTARAKATGGYDTLAAHGKKALDGQSSAGEGKSTAGGQSKPELNGKAKAKAPTRSTTRPLTLVPLTGAGPGRGRKARPARPRRPARMSRRRLKARRPAGPAPNVPLGPGHRPEKDNLKPCS